MVHREQEIKQLQVLPSAFHNAFLQLPQAGRHLRLCACTFPQAATDPLAEDPTRPPAVWFKVCLGCQCF